MRRLIKGIFGIVSFLLLGGACWGATVSGSVTNNNGAGRIYVGLFDQYGNVSYGTSVAAPANGSYHFDVYGVPQGTYMVGAFLDPAGRNDGVLYAKSPMGADSGVVVGNTDLTVDPITLQVPPDEPAGQVDANRIFAVPMDGAALIFWENPTNANGQINAESYNVYWGTNSDVGPGNTVNGGTLLNVPSQLDQMHQGLGGLVNGTSYYVAVESVLTGSASKPITRSGPFIAGAPAGGHSISGTINFTGFTPAGTVLVVADSDNARFITAVQADSSTVNFTLPGVTPGSYKVFAFADQNGNLRWDAGDLGSYVDAIPVTMQAADIALAAPVAVMKRNSSATFNTTVNSSSPNAPYALRFEFETEGLRVANVVVQGPQLGMTSIGQNSYGTFGLWNAPVASLKMGDVYNATVTYTDGSSEVLNLPVTGVIDTTPIAVAPFGSLDSANTAPTFAWRTDKLPPGDYQYEVRLHTNNGDDWTATAPASARSLQYTGEPLAPGQWYWWEVAAVDRFGNSGVSGQGFTLNGSAPTVTSVTPDTAVHDSTVTVNGAGFSGTPTVSFNGAIGTVTSVTPTALQVKVPVGASTGPVLVSMYDPAVNNSVTASTPAAFTFTPQVTYQNQVTDSNNNAIVGASAQVVQYPSITGATDTSGTFTLSGVPAGLPVTVSLTAAGLGLVPVYSHEGTYLSDNTPSGSFSMHTQAQLDGWNAADWNRVATGLGAIKGRTVDNNMNNMSGVVVKAYSTLHNASDYYTVAYSDGNNNVSTTATSTAGDGRYWVLNVEEGDVVIVSAKKSNFSFQRRTFRTHAGALSEAKVVGNPLPTISSITPLVTVPGGIITINGSHFSGIGNPDSVVFAGGAWGSVQEGSTDTQLLVQVPCDAQPGQVRVSVNGFSVTSSQSISFGAPTVTGIAPSAGIYGIGTQVTISGANFDTCRGNGGGNTQVIVNGLPTGYSLDTMTTTEILAYLPASALTGPITVSTPYGSAQSPTSFVVPAPPIYYSISPDSGPVGTTVTVSGLFGDLDITHYHVLIDGISAPIASINQTSLVCQIPIGTAAGLRTFQVVYANPTYTFAPTFGVTVPFTLTITGSGSVNSVTNGITFSCASGNCSSSFGYGTTLQLHASPSTGYAFNGWSGAGCSGTGDCTVNFLDAYGSVSLGALFSLQQYLKNGSTYYGTLADALGAAGNASVVQAQAITFVESPVFNMVGVGVLLKGGYDPSFGTNGGYTTIDGSFKVRNGLVRVERVKIK